MNPTTHPWNTSARVIWAITWKDLKEALKNKNTLTVLITALFVIAAYRGLPMLSAASEPIPIFIFNPGGSVLTALLENQSEYAVREFPSEEAMLNRLREEEVPALGLFIPPGFDLALQTGQAPASQAPALQVYSLYWLSSAQTETLRTGLEAEITRLTGQMVEIRSASNIVYTTPQSGGLGVQAALGLVFMQTMIGISLVPHLFMEEKQSHTMDTLLISPARPAEVVLAKALAGLFYSLLSGAAAYLINFSLVVHWLLAVLVVICAGLFVTAIGLWLGLRIETRAQLSMWSWVIIIPLFFPMIIYLLDDLMPDVVVLIARWVPTTAIFNTIRMAFAGQYSTGEAWLNLGYVLLWVAGILSLVAWRMRRMDQIHESQPSLWQTALQRRLRSVLRIAGAERSTQDNSARLQQRASSFQRAQASDAIKTPPAWQIILTIAGKDIRDILRSKLAISIIAGSAMLAVPNALLPRLIVNSSLPSLIVQDQGRSTLLRTLLNHPEFRLVLAKDDAEVDELLVGIPAISLGLELPADFDMLAGSGQTIRLAGRYVHWADRGKVQAAANLFADQLSLASQTEVVVELAESRVYPTLAMGGFFTMSSLVMILTVALMGMALVPLLLVEEKENHTLDALLVSPARYDLLLVGKALAGLAYCGVAIVTLLLIFEQYIVNWLAALMGFLIIALFSIAMGLLIGIISNSAQTTSVFGSLLSLLLIFPAFLQLLPLPNLPQIARSLLDWMPGTLMMQNLRYAMLQTVPWDLFLRDGLVLAAMALVVYILVAWRVSRWERR